ncbi:hypothetical protein Glove_328g122 [Diversispora epigaea]|uniref:Uncharacterized protein n=1 Tax=Diversispora epigaea TaxID=1348612 RepID=A0A397HRE0_9GLOM|nr:hypothetical protein Glove_328g122 [Diversispora epigaea]
MDQKVYGILCLLKFPDVILEAGGIPTMNDAAALGVRFLDKLESIVDYRSTFKVLELLWVVTGYAVHIYSKKYKIKINEIMNCKNNLVKVCTFAPLFSASEKSHYAESVIRFLAQLNQDPELQAILHLACSVNVTNDKNYYAFDEAMEILGVKFVKQNMSKSANIINLETLKLEIKSVQVEQERLDLFLSEFINNCTGNCIERSVQDQKEKIWNLVNDLLSVFEFSNPKEHSLFSSAQELYDEEYKRLFVTYENGLQRSKAILRQDILGTEDRKRKANNKDEIELSQNTIKRLKIINKPDSNKWQITTEEEKNILNLFVQAPKLTDQLVEEVKSKLSNWDTQRISLNLMVLLIVWITIFSLTSSVSGFGTFTHNETNSYETSPMMWQSGKYIDGTVVIRIINSNPYKPSNSTEWLRPVLSLRIIHPNGTVNEIDKVLEIQEFNWQIFNIFGINESPISIYALQRGYLIVRYFKASDTNNLTTYEEWGRIIDWNGNLYDEVNLGDAYIENSIWFPSVTTIIPNVDPAKGFIRIAGVNATYVEWQQYMIGDSFNLIKLQEGNFQLPQSGSAAISTMATVDEGYSIILANSTSSTNSNNLFEVYATVYDFKIGYNETQFSAPKLLYQSTISNITVISVDCSISSSGTGQVCMLTFTRNVTYYYVKLDFLISGSVTKTIPLTNLPELPRNISTGWQIESIPYGGYLLTSYFVSGSGRTVNGYYFNEIENSYSKWEFDNPSFLNLRGILLILPNNTLLVSQIERWQIESIPYGGYLLTSYFVSGSGRTVNGYYFNEIENSYSKWEFDNPSFLNLRGILLILPNNTLLVSQIESNNTWSLNTTDMPNYSGNLDHGYSNIIIDSTYPSINANISNISNLTDMGNITITYNQPVELSDGNIWIYLVDNSVNQNVTRQFVNANNYEYCSISEDGLTVTVKVIRSTFSYPNGQFYVKVDNNFVKSKVYDEPLKGINDNIWKFNTSPTIEETHPDPVSGALRLTIEGTEYYENLNQTGTYDFFFDLQTELSKILSIDFNRLNSNVRTQIDNTLPNRQILISLNIRSSKNERSVKSIIDDLNDMIKYKRITAISLFPTTNYLDEDFGFEPKQNLWKKYKIRILGAVLAFGILVVLFLFAHKKERKGRNVVVLQLGLIIFDFVMDSLFVSFNGGVVKVLYIPSVVFLIVPIIVNTIWAFYTIFNESRSKTFLDWFTQHEKAVLIFTVLSGADITALSILYSNLAGFEFFNAPFSTKGKNRIFWVSCLNIFVEGIPQVIIQILYLRNVVTYDIIPLFALISSCLNLLVNIVGRLFQAINICRHRSLEIPATESNFTSDELMSHSIHVKDESNSKKNSLTKRSSKGSCQEVIS